MLCDVMLHYRCVPKIGFGAAKYRCVPKNGFWDAKYRCVPKIKVRGIKNIVVYLKLGPAVKLTCLRMHF